MESHLAQLLETLGYSNSDGLILRESEGLSPNLAFIWSEIQRKFDLDAAYFRGDVPVVYFKGLQQVGEDDLFRLHLQMWNHNSAPLLIAVLPEEVRVYNCFLPPLRTDDVSGGSQSSPLLEIVQLATSAVEIANRLSPYSCSRVESGSLHEVLSVNDRADQRLLMNLHEVRAQLLVHGLTRHVANALLARSIFVRYLEDRGVLAQDFLTREFGRPDYVTILRSKQLTYQLFAFLADRFNGDLFPVDDDEIDLVTEESLDTLSHFMRGTDMPSGQMYFWAYDFEFISTELISSIYEEFLRLEQSEIGAYYTPPSIVTFVLNELMISHGSQESTVVLDPACGSGIFLVEAFRRLVFRAKNESKDGNVSFARIKEILTTSIFGIDIDPDAIRVAAFSCYLTMLDFLSPKSIWESVVFPNLIGSNLLVQDFFVESEVLSKKKFDVVVGNPPWKSKLSDSVKEYLTRHNRAVGDMQLAQAFMWRACDVAVENGRLCLLTPSKSVLFNTSATNVAFRSKFLGVADVKVVVDFSLFRKSLFINARAPMAAIFFGPARKGDDSDVIRYCTPRPSRLSDTLPGVVLSGDEIRKFSRSQLLAHPDLWKIALWGSQRDFAFINDLRERFSTLREVIVGRGWISSEGLQKSGGDKNHAPEIRDLVYVPTKSLRPLAILSNSSERLDQEYFHRVRNPAIYSGPHVLLKEGVLKGGIIAANYLDYHAVFLDKVIGIAGPPSDSVALKALAGILNSSIVRYYHFLTSASWGVERDVVQYSEHLTLPYPFENNDDPLLGQIADLVDEIQVSGMRHDVWAPQLDELVSLSYGLVSSERQLISDTLEYSLTQFERGTQASAFDSVSSDALGDYAAAFTAVLNPVISSLQQRFESKIYEGTANYRAVSFELSTSMEFPLQPVFRADEELNSALLGWNKAVVESNGTGTYLRRNLKSYGDDSIHIIKPDERRFWTQTSAFNDADESIAYLMKVARDSK